MKRQNYLQKRRCPVLIAMFMFSAVIACGAEESITVTTYYPSPYGVYSEMRLYPKNNPTACDNNQRGLMYYDLADNRLKVCNGTPPYQDIGGGFWAASPSGLNDIYYINSGNVGIGTNSPGQKLVVQAADASSSTGTGPTIYLQSDAAATLNRGGSVLFGDTGTARAMIKGAYEGAGSSGYLALSTKTSANVMTEALRIDSGGNIGIGTPGPTSRLHVNGKSRFNDRVGIYFGPDDIPPGWGGGLVTWDVVAKAQIRANSLCLGGSVGGNDLGTCRNSWPGAANVLTSTNGQYALTMQDDGNVVLYTPWGARFTTGTYSGKYGPYYLMSGNGRYYFVMQDDANLVIYDNWTGQPIWATSWSPDGDWRPWLSDARLKKDVALLEGALAKVMRLRGVAFSWKDTTHGEGPQVGLIAQEVEKIFPEAVTTGGDGFKRVDYGRLVSPLIEAIKSQQIEIKKQGESIQQLQEELNKLKSESKI